jgi:hypothetical protein
MEKDALGDVCPACGVKKEMFEPWEDKVGAARRFYLELHVHPIIVHLPNSISPILLLVALAFPLFPGFQTYLWPTLQLLSWLFPLAVFGGFASGLVDGKVRYRKVTTPLLLKKIILGTLLFIVSIVQAVLVSVTSNFGPGNGGLWTAYVIAALVSLVLASVLGKWGSSLFSAAMPGDKVFLGKKKKPAAKAAPKAPEAK